MFNSLKFLKYQEVEEEVQCLLHLFSVSDAREEMRVKPIRLNLYTGPEK